MENILLHLFIHSYVSFSFAAFKDSDIRKVIIKKVKHSYSNKSIVFLDPILYWRN